MALITDRQVINFVNTIVRPFAETMRNFDAENDSGLVSWNGQISALLSAFSNADTIEDGREAEGISRLTKADVVNFITQMNAYQTQLDGVGVAQVISKPTVRPLKAG